MGLLHTSSNGGCRLTGLLSSKLLTRGLATKGIGIQNVSNLDIKGDSGRYKNCLKLTQWIYEQSVWYEPWQFTLDFRRIYRGAVGRWLFWGEVDA